MMVLAELAQDTSSSQPRDMDTSAMGPSHEVNGTLLLVLLVLMKVH